MRVIISQPMAGIPDEEIRLNFNQLKEKFEKLHIDVVDNIWQDTPPEGAYYCEPLFYLSKSVNAIGQVDAVYFAEGWKNARGCLIERQICESYGIKILETEWLLDTSSNNMVSTSTCIKSNSIGLIGIK